MPVQGIIFYDIFINIAQCATANVVKAENSNGAIFVATYVGGGRIDINLQPTMTRHSLSGKGS